MEQSELIKEYYLPGNNIGCLVIHGFTSTPAEHRQLGEFLNKSGYSVSGIRLKGHGTNVDELEKCSYTDWIQSAVDGYKELKGKTDKIYVVGHSMGALLALYLAENFEVDKVAVLSPPLVNNNKLAGFAFVLRHFVRYVEWEPVERSEEESKYLLGYDKIPVRSINEFNKLNRLIKEDLHKINKPLLIIHSHKDDTVSEKSVNILYGRSSSEFKKIVFLKKSGHNITIECEKLDVFNEVKNFLE